MSLAEFIDARIFMTRSIGSFSSVARLASRPDTRFWYVSDSPPLRMLTGTMAISGSSGSAPRSSR